MTTTKCEIVALEKVAVTKDDSIEPKVLRWRDLCAPPIYLKFQNVQMEN